MKNKQLQEFLAQYPDDLRVDLHCANYHTGQIYQYECTSVDLVKREFTVPGYKGVEEFKFIILNGRAD